MRVTFGILSLLLTSLSFQTFSQNTFTFELFSNMNKKSNLLFSPTSIKVAFSMAYEGANGTTQKEFEEVFGFQEDNSAFLKEIEHLKSVAEISNSIWILTNYDILPKYIQKIKKGFNAEPNYTDFENDPIGSADKINKWISESTKGMIQKMVSPDAVTDFKMALVNAIYFKEDWKHQFNKKLTQKQPFKNFNGDEQEVDLMHTTRNFRAFDGNDEKIIELPYKDDKTSMVILLPNNMKKYKLTEESYSNLTARMGNQQVNFYLPKFTFETPTFELKSFMKMIGLNTAFENSADFSGMRKQKDLKIGTALHKAKIIVDEEGTEAAAATVIGMVRTTSAPSIPVRIMEMRVDKPFYYFIKDNQTGTILFMGRMNSM